MKILIAAEIFPPDIGGPATYSPKIAQALVDNGFEVKLICYSNQKQTDQYPFSVFRVVRNKLKLHYLKYYFQLKKLAQWADIIYAQGPVSSGWPALKVVKKLKKKLVVKVVGDYAWEQARNLELTELDINEFQAKKFSGKIGKLQQIERSVCRQADRVIVPSRYLAGIVEGWGAAKEKVTVIYNSFELDTFSHSAADNNLIISVGRLVPWKGFEILISLMPELLKENKNFKLMIFGDGPQKTYLNDLISRLNLQEKVFIHFRGHGEIKAYLRTAGMFVLNTGYEGLSHAILEAMVAGLPVITTNVGGNPELIKAGENGLLVEYNNKEQIKEAILKLYNDPELAKQFVDNSKKVLNQFTHEEMINKTIETLKSL